MRGCQSGLSNLDADIALLSLAFVALALSMMGVLVHSCWIGGKRNYRASSENPMKTALTSLPPSEWVRQAKISAQGQISRPFSICAFYLMQKEQGWHYVAMGIFAGALALIFIAFGTWIYLGQNACLS